VPNLLQGGIQREGAPQAGAIEQLELQPAGTMGVGDGCGERMLMKNICTSAELIPAIETLESHPCKR
jgi:hypothetical protein